FFAFLTFDLIKRWLGDVDSAGADQVSHLPEKESQQQRADVRSIDIGVCHDDDPAIPQFRNIKSAFVLAVAIFFGLADARSDSGDHRLDFVVFKELIFTRFFHVYQFSPDRKDGLITSIAALLCGATGRITLYDIKLSQFGITLGAIGKFPR